MASTPFRRFNRLPIVQRFVGGAVRLLTRIFRWLGPDRAGAVAGGVARLFGPLVPEHRVALLNLEMAFPGMSLRERKRVLAGVWDNLGRVATEYVHLAGIVDSYDGPPEDRRVEIVGLEHFLALRDSGRPAIVFAGHLANFELPAVAAAKYGLKIVSLFRPPQNSPIAEDLLALRSELIGKMVSTRDNAAIEVAAALEQGATVGLLIDQRVNRQIEVPFFGRDVSASPLLGRLARQYEVPVHGVRCIRLKGARFRIEMTPALDLPRDADGRVDVTGTMALVNRVLEGWVREHPEQWLWLHNRWRLKNQLDRRRAGRGRALSADEV